MRIAYLLPGVGISGGVGVVLQHVNRLKKRGHDVVLLTQSYETDTHWFPNQNVEVYYFLDCPYPIDVLIATGWSTAFDVAKIKSKHKCYFVQSDETRFFPKEDKNYHLAYLSYCMDFNYFTEAKWIVKWLKNFSRDASYVPNGLDEKIFFETKPFAEKGTKTRILLEGPIDIPYKGMEDAFQAVTELDEDIEVWCVSGAGQPKKEWRCDRFFEKVQMEDMKKIYSSCDILLKMSRVEGFFGPPLEMMACGGVSIVSKVSGYDEYIVDGQNAVVVEERDVNGAKKAIKKLIHDKEFYNLLQTNGKRTVEEWNWERSIDMLEEFIKSLDSKTYYNHQLNDSLNHIYYNSIQNTNVAIAEDMVLFEVLQKRPKLMKLLRQVFTLFKRIKTKFL